MANAVKQKPYFFLLLQPKMVVLWLCIVDKMVNIYIYIYILLLLKYILFYYVGGGGCCLF